jgi:mycothiol maleylpyruvate isomerase-like protein
LARAVVTAVTAIPPLEHDEAMALAEVELGRVLALVDDDLDADEWSRPTDCTGWTVRDMLGHLLGMFALQADPEERTRQIKTAVELVRRLRGAAPHGDDGAAGA